MPAGNLFVYSMRSFHRNTAFKYDSARLGMFLTYGPMAYKWMEVVDWSQEAPRAECGQWMELVSVEERNSVGSPAPGNPNWSEDPSME